MSLVILQNNNLTAKVQFFIEWAKFMLLFLPFCSDFMIISWEYVLLMVFLLWKRQLEVHLFLSHRMTEPKLGGM